MSLTSRFIALPLVKQVDSIWRVKNRDIVRLCAFVHHCRGIRDINRQIPALDQVHRDRLHKLVQIFNLTQEQSFLLDGRTERLNMQKKFEALESMVDIVAHGESHGLLVLGAGGIGKTYSVESVLNKSHTKYIKMNGYVSHTALYNFLYVHRKDICLIDDADSVFDDVTPLNILKAVLDTNETREVSWLTPSPAITAPSTFRFQGKAIFITNISLDKIKKSVPHMEALLTRILFVNFEVSRADIMDRMTSIAKNCEYKNIQRSDRMRVLSFIKQNVEAIRDLNLRTLIHAYDVFLFKQSQWQRNLRFMWSVRS